MAPATSPAVASSAAPRGRTALVAFALLSFAAPALAAEQVYIWRDAERHRPLQRRARFLAKRPRRRQATRAPECPEQPPAVVLTDANQRAAY